MFYFQTLISNIRSNINEEICYNRRTSSVKQREPENLIQLHTLTERNADQKESTRNKFDKNLVTLNHLRDRKFKHSGIKTYKCDVCYKTFARSYNLSQHKQIHNGIKMYECDVCLKTFTQSPNLSRHKQIHSGIKKYECDAVSYTHLTHIYYISTNLEINVASIKHQLFYLQRKNQTCKTAD